MILKIFSHLFFSYNPFRYVFNRTLLTVKYELKDLLVRWQQNEPTKKAAVFTEVNVVNFLSTSKFLFKH